MTTASCFALETLPVAKSAHAHAVISDATKSILLLSSQTASLLPKQLRIDDIVLASASRFMELGDPLQRQLGFA